MAMSASTGFCYSEASSNGDPTNNNIQVSQLQSLGHNSEIYSMDMVGFPSKDSSQNDAVLWKGPVTKSSDHFYPNDDLMKPNQDWNQSTRLVIEDPSLRFAFPNQRPNQGQGLSLTLSSSSPSCLRLQSFDLLRQPDEARFGPSSSRSVNYHHDQRPHVVQEGLFHVRNSKHLRPAQELLNEFCSFDMRQSEVKQKVQWEESTEDATSKQSLYALDLLELQKRRTKLHHMLEEVNRRYKHYCDQMRTVVSSFEAVAGEGTAVVYTAMAARAMSRHFKCLKDGILRQIKATKTALGDKDTAAPGTTKGETPRLRILDQSLRQQRAFQQLSMMESHPWRPQRGLPERSVSVLRAWLFEHFLHPYPSDVDKHILARQTGLSRSQVSNWFINARVRLWKPMVEEMYLQDLKETQPNQLDKNENNDSRPIEIPDQKPPHDQLIGNETDSLSSLVVNNNSAKDDSGNRTLDQADQFTAAVVDEYNAVRSGFVSSYGTGLHSSSGVSLTLGLQQHGGGGLGLGYSPAAVQNSLFCNPRDQMEECQTVQYSLMESESQNMQYRNLMGAQLLRDLAG